MATGEISLLVPEVVLRLLGDRSYDRRKQAALRVEDLVKGLARKSKNSKDKSILSIVTLLGERFCRSTNANHRKGGLIGIAATAIGLGRQIDLYLEHLVPHIINCFTDSETRVRYYACEALFNVAKVARQRIIEEHINQIFTGLCILYGDIDVDVKNGAQLLNRLIKEIVTESDSFDMDSFVPLLQEKIEIINPYVRQLLVGWIVTLDSVPFINMLDYLPNFLSGLFNMLSADQKEIRVQADQALSNCLEEVMVSDPRSLPLSDIVIILIKQASAHLGLTRLTAMGWLSKVMELAQYMLKDKYADLLRTFLYLLSDKEKEIMVLAQQANRDLIKLVSKTHDYLDLAPLLQEIKKELHSKHAPTREHCLTWLNVLLERDGNQVLAMEDSFSPVLLHTLSDDSDRVVLMNLKVMARIASSRPHFRGILTSVLGLFRETRELLDTRGSLIIRNFCRFLDGKEVFMALAEILRGETDVVFAKAMVQTLNMILLTAPELVVLRNQLENTFDGDQVNDTSLQLFTVLYLVWCHNPIAAFGLCLLAQAYHLSEELVRQFVRVEMTLDIFMQIDKLVSLLESPIFLRVRIQLLDPHHPSKQQLIKSLYGLLMLVPQTTAFTTLNARLSSITPLYVLLDKTGAGAGAHKTHPGGEHSPQRYVSEQKALAKHFATIQAQHEANRKKQSTLERFEMKDCFVALAPPPNSGHGTLPPTPNPYLDTTDAPPSTASDPCVGGGVSGGVSGGSAVPTTVAGASPEPTDGGAANSANSGAPSAAP